MIDDYTAIGIMKGSKVLRGMRPTYARDPIIY